ncbi:MAG: hypothetical protein PHD15_02310 [Clostridia bacterium]|nr:hypothetical protein [Clostridia bacterium]MDD4386580.1 hypothetical protein [Clostridia bacterium]
MRIIVGFDCYAKIVECDNLNLSQFPELLENFKEWLYVENEGCLCIKKSLNVEILDISVVLRFLNENYPDFNARVVNDYIVIENIDESLPIIAL